MIEPIVRSGKPDASKARCFDCTFCRAAVGWWCVNGRAVKVHGTTLPGRSGCKFWKPARMASDVGWFERVFKGMGLLYFDANKEEETRP